jgi:hypothetical protein
MAFLRDTQGGRVQIPEGQDVRDLAQFGFDRRATAIETIRSCVLFSEPNFQGNECWIFCPPGGVRSIADLAQFAGRARSLFWARGG